VASATRRDTASSRRRRARLSTVPSFTPADSLVQPADDDGGGGGGRDDKDGLLLGAGDRASLGWWASGGSSNGLGAADMVHARWSLVSKIPDCLYVRSTITRSVTAISVCFTTVLSHTSTTATW
jgi:hypothetical protein